MRVLKLNEASSGQANVWKDSYNSAKTADEKFEVLKDALLTSSPKGDVDINVINRLKSFGYDFITRWVDAMRWDEISREDNEFMNILRMSSGNEPFLESVSNFSKLYNTYSDGSIENRYLSGGDLSNIFLTLMNNSRTYQYNDGDFRELFSLFDDLASSGTTPSNLKTIFFEMNGNNVKDIKSPAMIKQKYNEYNKRNNRIGRQSNSKMSTEQIKSIIDQALTNTQMRNYVRDRLNNENNNLQ